MSYGDEWWEVVVVTISCGDERRHLIRVIVQCRTQNVKFTFWDEVQRLNLRNPSRLCAQRRTVAHVRSLAPAERGARDTHHLQSGGHRPRRPTISGHVINVNVEHVFLVIRSRATFFLAVVRVGADMMEMIHGGFELNTSVKLTIAIFSKRRQHAWLVQICPPQKGVHSNT